MPRLPSPHPRPKLLCSEAGREGKRSANQVHPSQTSHTRHRLGKQLPRRLRCPLVSQDCLPDGSLESPRSLRHPPDEHAWPCPHPTYTPVSNGEISGLHGARTATQRKQPVAMEGQVPDLRSLSPLISAARESSPECSLSHGSPQDTLRADPTLLPL